MPELCNEDVLSRLHLSVYEGGQNLPPKLLLSLKINNLAENQNSNFKVFN